jgi:hypothetical protein
MTDAIDNLRPAKDIVADRLLTRFSLETITNDFAVPAWGELAELAWSLLPNELQNGSSVTLPPEGAAIYLTELIRQWDRRCRRIGRFSQAMWLYVARRIPDVLFDTVARIHEIPEDYVDLARTIIRRLLIAQTGSANIMGDHPIALGGTTAYDLTDIQAAEVIRRLFMIEYLWRVQGTYRLAGKGASVRINRGAAPDAEAGIELKKSTELFDERMRNSSSATHLVGTVPWEEAGNPGASTICLLFDDSEPEIILHAPPRGAVWKAGTSDELDNVAIAHTYPIKHYDMASFAMLSSFSGAQGAWYDSELPALLTLLHAISQLVRTEQTIDWQLIRVGYLRITPTTLRSLIAEHSEQIKTS